MSRAWEILHDLSLQLVHLSHCRAFYRAARAYSPVFTGLVSCHGSLVVRASPPPSFMRIYLAFSLHILYMGSARSFSLVHNFISFPLPLRTMCCSRRWRIAPLASTSACLGHSKITSFAVCALRSFSYAPHCSHCGVVYRMFLLSSWGRIFVGLLCTLASAPRSVGALPLVGV
jgi:hypothetical protein